MNIDRWLAVIGLLGTFVGFPLAYYFYIKTIKTKRLAYAYTRPVSLQLPLSDKPPPYLHDAKGSSRVFMLLWNRGTAPIEKSDFVQPIKVGPAERVLHVEAHEQDTAVATTVNDAEKSISIELLRPGEAVIFLIDAMVVDFTPEVSIVMKSADMSEFLRSAPIERRDVIPVIAAIAIFALLAWALIWSLFAFDLFSASETAQFYFFLAVGISWPTFFGLAYLTYKLVRRSTLWGDDYLPPKFFYLQKTCSEINRSWNRLQNESWKLMAMG
jgi:hypothetical protein